MGGWQARQTETWPRRAHRKPTPRALTITVGPWANPVAHATPPPPLPFASPPAPSPATPPTTETAALPAARATPPPTAPRERAAEGAKRGGRGGAAGTATPDEPRPRAVPNRQGRAPAAVHRSGPGTARDVQSAGRSATRHTIMGTVSNCRDPVRLDLNSAPADHGLLSVARAASVEHQLPSLNRQPPSVFSASHR